MAMQHPEVVAGLAVLNGPHPATFLREVRRPGQALRSWYQVFCQLPWLPEETLRAGGYALLKHLFRRDPMRPGAYTEGAIQRNVAAMAQPGALTAALNYYRAAWRRGWRQTLREARVVEGPVLVIWGEGDRYLSLRLTRGLERWAPGVRVERIAGASHWVQHDAPHRVNELLLALLRHVSGQRAGSGCDREP